MKSAEISRFLQERIDAGDFPSAVYLVAEKGETVIQEALGYAVVVPERIEAEIDTIYDLASLTKVLVTGLLVAKAIEENLISLEDSLGSLLRNFESSDKGDISVKQLVTHSSGLPAWKPFYLLASTPSEIVSTIASIPLEEPQPLVVYSDLNFLLLQAILEDVYGQPLVHLAASLFKQLGLTDTTFNPDQVTQARIAASEKGNEHEKRTCQEQGYELNGFKFREYQIWGEVHDGNAWFMRGVAGHAGLFSTADDVLELARQFLPDYTSILKSQTCQLFSTNLTPGMNEARSLSFQLAETPKSTAGEKMSPQSFGHLGFTGTSLWIDPVIDRVFILLTNRTHSHPLPFININSVRRGFQNLAIDMLNRQK
jgi:CubicO group peptidase (beta-lactamase class C family)